MCSILGCSRDPDPEPQKDMNAGVEDMTGTEDQSPPADMPSDMSREVYRPPAPINPKAIAFGDACQTGDRITIAAVGDVLLHSRLQRQGVKHEDRFRSLWAPVDDLIEGADIAYANLEGPTASGVLEGGELTDDPGFRFDGDVYSTWPRFNYHPYLVEDLEMAGFDVVSTANNHTLDRAGVGVDRTIDALESAGEDYAAAAEALGVSERTLYRYINRYDLEP